MIVMRIQGGIGNQMFQWACGRALSKSRDSKLFLEITNYRFDSRRKFQLNLFSRIHNLISENQVSIIDGWLPNELIQVNDDFQTLEFPTTEKLFLNGYWQSEKHFSDTREIILDDFNLDEYSKVRKNYPDLSTSVSLHVRRTDYVSSNGFHPVQSLDYYEQAINKLDNDYTRIYVFSDDIEWCKENIKFDNCFFVDNNDEMESLSLMSNCRHNITANSSFSWWAAWLNPHKDKKVVCPSQWFGEVSNINASNIYFENCIVI